MISICAGNHSKKHWFLRSERKWMRLHSECPAFTVKTNHSNCFQCEEIVQRYLDKYSTLRVISSTGHEISITCPPLPEKRGKLHRTRYQDDPLGESDSDSLIPLEG